MRRTVPKMQHLPLPPELEGTPIGHCCEAWNRRYEVAIAEGRGEISCRLRSNEAFRVAMPPLTSLENIRNFLSCVTYGLLVGTILPEIATRLFYAAQVALATLKSPSQAAQTPGRRKALPEADASPADPGMPLAG